MPLVKKLSAPLIIIFACTNLAGAGVRDSAIAAVPSLTAFPAGATVLIGAIIMTGGCATQGVVLISFINEYRQKGLPPRESILEAAPVRVRPTKRLTQ